MKYPPTPLGVEAPRCASAKKKPLHILLQLGGVWMVGVRGHVGPYRLAQWSEAPRSKLRGIRAEASEQGMKNDNPPRSSLLHVNRSLFRIRLSFNRVRLFSLFFG